MSTEHPIFRGDLHPVPGIIAREGKFLEHPALPDKFIRAEKGQYTTLESALPNIRYFAKTTALLKSEYNIPHVDYQMIIGETEAGSFTTYLVVEKLSNAINFDQILQRDFSQEQMVDMSEEYDFLTSNLLRYLKDIACHGGVFACELILPSQSMYVSSRPRGERCVLVDVEPMEARVVKKIQDDPNNLSGVSIIGSRLIEITAEVIRLEQKLGRSMFARQDIEAVCAVLPDATAAVMQLKGDIQEALQANDTALLAAATHEDEDGTTDHGYWFLFQEQNPWPASANAFPNDEWIQRYLAG